MKLWVVGLNHNTAPVELRENLFFEREELHPTLRRLTRNDLIREGVLLSTCNRTELYFLSGDNLENPADIFIPLCQEKNVEFDEVNDHLYELNHLRAVEHAFKVAGSLNSMVIGESQILGQVKQAYDIAREGGFCGKFLHQMFQNAFRIAKRIRTETNINRLPTSVGSAAVALAKQIFGDLSERSVLVLGSGKMGQLCIEHLKENGASRLIIANRTLSRANKLARRFQAKPIELDQFETYLSEVDIIISSTGAPDPILDRSQLRDVLYQRGSHPLFIIDIAVPRDVNEDVRALDNVYLYNIDDLKSVVDSNLSYRETELEKAQEFIADGVSQFEDWLKTQDMGPLIRELKQEVYQLVEREIREHLEQPGSPYKKSDLQLVAHRITNKLLDDPLNVMKEKAIEGETDTLMAVREIFNLDEDITEQTG